VAAGRLDPDDLSRFEGEDGPEIPEPAASDPQESIYEPKQKGSHYVMSFKTFRRVVFESDHGRHYRQQGLFVAVPRPRVRPAFLKWPSPPEPLAGRRNGPQHTRQQEMES
jgi:hypothetical protein